jgi:hypothetical protein
MEVVAADPLLHVLNVEESPDAKVQSVKIRGER